MTEEHEAFSRTAGGRLLYALLGWLFLALGLIGAILPVLPTTPFLIVAAWAFARSSERWRRWLVTHPKFGPTIQAWEDFGVIPLRAKIASALGMVGSLIFMGWFSDAPFWATLLAAGLMAIGAVYIWRRPSETPAAFEKGLS